ncbi:MAG: hypothetical protein GC185_10450 [Alphaproteobacteria bacterium]|nr:hypothetical protein [Alphaproteobacteria bacterium]
MKKEMFVMAALAMLTLAPPAHAAGLKIGAQANVQAGAGADLGAGPGAQATLGADAQERVRPSLVITTDNRMDDDTGTASADHQDNDDRAEVKAREHAAARVDAGTQGAATTGLNVQVGHEAGLNR